MASPEHKWLVSLGFVSPFLSHFIVSVEVLAEGTMFRYTE